MKVPKTLVKKLKDFAREGFHVVDVEPRKSSHFLLKFAELPGETYLVTCSKSCPRAFKNCLADLRRMQRKTLV